MPRTSNRKDHPLSIRLSEADIAIIDDAARLRGCSRADFVRETAVQAAEDVLMETAHFKMSAADFRRFMNALSRPTVSVPEMAQLFARKSPWE
jgi:uncharacterized protein (DUF1778 family)